MKQNRCRWYASKGKREEGLPHSNKSGQDGLPSITAAKGCAKSFGNGSFWLPSNLSSRSRSAVKERVCTTSPLTPNTSAVLAHAVPQNQPSAHQSDTFSHGSHAMPISEFIGNTNFPVNGPCDQIPPKEAAGMASPNGPCTMSPAAPHGMVPSSSTFRMLPWSSPEDASRPFEGQLLANGNADMAAENAFGAGHALGIHNIPRRQRVGRLSLLLRHWCALYQVQQRQQASPKTSAHGTLF